MNKFLSTEFDTKVLCNESKIESTDEDDDVISLMMNFINAILISLSDIMKDKSDDLNWVMRWLINSLIMWTNWTHCFRRRSFVFKHDNTSINFDFELCSIFTISLISFFFCWRKTIDFAEDEHSKMNEN